MNDAVSRPVSAKGVHRAADRLAGHLIRTPLIENEFIDQAAGRRVLLKAEVLQHCGSFKFRGAFNLISQLDDDLRKRGVIAWSSGNHAQGVALAARHFGVPATIVMPQDAPAIKTDKVRALGAKIIFFDRYTENREEIARAIQSEQGLSLVPSFDHPDIIEGQGTLAIEAAEDVRALGLEMDTFVTCCGGGGLTAGCALALEDVSPQTKVWIAEPEGFDETRASLESGKRETADVTQPTICDAIATPSPGELTFPVMRRLVAGGAAVSRGEVEYAMAMAFRHLKLVVEPGGAVALAAVLAGKIKNAGNVTGVTLSGGNVDSALFSDILSRN